MICPARTIDALGVRLFGLMGDIASLFKTRTNDSSPLTELHMKGLRIEASRKNMEVMDRRLGDGS